MYGKKIAESGHEMAQLWQRIAAMRYVGFSVYFRGGGTYRPRVPAC